MARFSNGSVCKTQTERRHLYVTGLDWTSKCQQITISCVEPRHMCIQTFQFFSLSLQDNTTHQETSSLLERKSEKVKSEYTYIHIRRDSTNGKAERVRYCNTSPLAVLRSGKQDQRYKGMP